MRIGVNSRIYQGRKSGIPYYLQCLYETLQRIDKENSYAFFQTADSRKLGQTMVTHALPGYIGALQFDLLTLPQIAAREKIDILHGPSHTLPIYKKTGMKYVLTVHDLFLLKFPQMSPVYYRLMFKKILERSLNIADIVVADSHSTKKDIVEIFNVAESKVRVIHLGINSLFLRNEPQSRTIEEPYFFSITTHPERKNITSVLKVMAEHKNLQSFVYVIAGLMDDETVVGLKALIHSLGLTGRVKLLGFVTEEQLLSLYQHATFFIFPSFYEGFGFPVLEAMASGCPVITSNTSSLIEIMPHAAWRIDPYDLNSISDTMLRMVDLDSHQRNLLIAQNKEFASAFTWEKTAVSHLQLFNDLVRK